MHIGALQTRALSRFALAVVCQRAIALAKEDGTSRIQIAYEGQWKGHPSGDFQFTTEIFESLIANRNRRTDDPPVTYGHPNGEVAAHMGAAGWIKELEIGTDEEGRTALFARVKWTKRAAKMIADDELRYCSVVVGFDSVDEVSGDPIGPELFEVGVVLAAFLDGMQPLQLWRPSAPTDARAASRGRKGSDMADTKTKDAKPTVALGVDVEQLKAALDQLEGDEITEDQIRKIIDANLLQQSAVGGDAEPAEEPAAADDAPVDVAAGDEPTGDTVAAEDEPSAPEEPAAMPDIASRLAEALGMSPEDAAAALDAHFDEIAALIAGTDSQAPSASAMSRIAADAAELGRKLRDATARIDVLESERDAAQRDAEISAAVLAGAMLEDERDFFTKLGNEAPNLFKTQLADRMKDPKVPLGRKVHAAPPVVESDGDLAPLDATEERIVAMCGRNAPQSRINNALRHYRKKQAERATA